ncbi:hypothetical protein CLD22_08035 [Rubrivivax gelatinosus]|nr:hypothetical protein [Rubrivivax gelatinosus]
MAKPNYAFEKRQRELAKKRKKEEKQASRKSGPGSDQGGYANDNQAPDGAPAPGAPAPAAGEEPAA